MPNIDSLIRQFLEYCEVGKNQSRKTIENYDHYLKRFFHWAGDIEAKAITLDGIQKYRLFLNRFQNEKGRMLSRKTQNYHIIALRAFLKYLIKNDIETLAPEKIELSKIPERTVSFLTREEIDLLFQAVDTKKITGLRDLAILEMLFSTGLRVSELAALNRNQVDSKRREFMVRGKGRKPRIVFLTQRAADCLEKYLRARTDAFAPLFVNHGRSSAKDITLGEKRRLTTVSIEAFVRKYAGTAGIMKKVTPHTIRHSMATNLLMNGADIRAVQEMLGHASITTTQIYTHLTNRRLREIHEKYHK